MKPTRYFEASANSDIVVTLKNALSLRTTASAGPNSVQGVLFDSEVSSAQQRAGHPGQINLGLISKIHTPNPALYMLCCRLHTLGPIHYIVCYIQLTSALCMVFCTLHTPDHYTL